MVDQDACILSGIRNVSASETYFDAGGNLAKTLVSTISEKH
jgi:hypothetical protein